MPIFTGATRWQNSIYYCGEIFTSLAKVKQVIGFSVTLEISTAGFFILPIQSSDFNSLIDMSDFDGAMKMLGNSQNSSIQDAQFSTIKDLSRYLDSNNILKYIGEFYPDWLFALYHLDAGFQTIQTWVEFEPKRIEEFYLPTFWSINGEWNLNSEIYVDDQVWMGSDLGITGFQFNHKLLPKFSLKRNISGWYKNADTVSSVESIQSGYSDMIQRRPFVGIHW